MTLRYISILKVTPTLMLVLTFTITCISSESPLLRCNIKSQQQQNKTNIVLVHQARGNLLCEPTAIVLEIPCCLVNILRRSGTDWLRALSSLQPQSPAPTESGCATDIWFKEIKLWGLAHRHIWSTAFSISLDLRQSRCNHDQREPAHSPPAP